MNNNKTFTLFRQLLVDVWRNVGPISLLYVVLMVFTGLLEGLTLASVVPLLLAVGVGSSGVADQGHLGSLVSRTFQALGVDQNVYTMSAFLLCALLLSAGFFLLQAHLSFRLQTSYVFSWHKRLFHKVFGARWPFFVEHKAGDIVNTITTETYRIGGAFYQAAILITGVVHSIIYFAIAATLSSVATAGVLVGGALMFASTRSIIRRAHAIGTGISLENASLQQSLIEFVTGAKLIKATATEGVAVSVLSGTADRLRHLSYRNSVDVQIVKAIFDFGSSILIAGILVVGCGALKISPAVILVVIAIFIRLLPKLTGIQQGFQSLTVSLPALESLRRLFIVAGEKSETVEAFSSHDEIRTKPFSVDLRNVFVEYEKRQILKGINLTIVAGKVHALVGGSGAGKTTLVDAILGLIMPSGGEIFISGIPLTKIPLSVLRKNIGYIAQDTILYNETIRKNLLWGHNEYSDERIKSVSASLATQSFIESMPQGLDTLVGDRGTCLSGGERQRLGLIRALLGDPGLLILDEATSALDAETERIVTQAIETLKGKVTVVMIAHRLSSVRVADCIHVLDDGCIVEEGSWSDLARPGTRFWDLWSLQKGTDSIS